VFAAGALWWAAAVGPSPDYVSALLPGILLTGVGVGLAMPTLFVAAGSVLPPARFATGSAVVSMARQIGFVVGVALLVAVLGAASSAGGQLAAFERGWAVTAAVTVAGAVAGVVLHLTSRRRAVLAATGSGDLTAEAVPADVPTAVPAEAPAA
jgi:hypothetical protein